MFHSSDYSNLIEFFLLFFKNLYGSKFWISLVMYPLSFFFYGLGESYNFYMAIYYLEIVSKLFN